MAPDSTALSIPFINLAFQHGKIKDELLQAMANVLDHGLFISGPEVGEFEERFAEYCGARYAVGVGNGTDALILTLKALGIGAGDEVITAPNSFLASASAIALTGATPVFVDVRNDFNLDPNLLETAITPKTRAILPVHLTGRAADMLPILATAGKHGLAVIEDAAQAVGAGYHGQKVGSFGNAGCFSLHPLKNLNACGDGGVITTNDEGVYRYLLKARNHGLRNRDGCEFWSINSRLDTLHAAMLLVKLKHLDTRTEARKANAEFYRKHLSDLVQTPQEEPYDDSVYQTFVIQADRREELRIYLKNQGVETKVHYPIPIHLQEAAKTLGYKAGDFPVAERQAKHILSLPIYPGLTRSQLKHVVNRIHYFYNAYLKSSEPENKHNGDINATIS